MNEYNKYIRFDWAAKRMLRDKANFGVLEGLVTVLLAEPIHIVEILESEGNQEAADDKYNRVDIKAKNSKDEIIIVEIQLTRELHYLERILYGVAKAITEHINLGQQYDKVKKVYSISIVYFDLGQGADYLYHGQNVFRGVHTNDTLRISTKEKDIIEMKTPEQVFPEYFIIRVNEFNTVAKTPLEEWIDYLKNGHIKEDTAAPGLQEAREKLQYLMMDKKERYAYDEHLNAVMIQNDVLSTAKKEGLYEGRMEGLAKGRAEGRAEGRQEGLAQGRAEGRAEGLSEGLAKGRAEGLRDAAKKMKDNGLPIPTIAEITGLDIEEVAEL